MDPVTLYQRFACANNFDPESLEYHLGLYLIYIGIIDLEIVKTYTYTQLACASLHLSQRMIRKDYEWSEYLQKISQLEFENFRDTCHKLAHVYVHLVNKEEAFMSGYDALLTKFSNENLHRSAALFVPHREACKK